MSEKKPDSFILEQLYRNNRIPAYVYAEKKMLMTLPAEAQTSEFFEKNPELLQRIKIAVDKENDLLLFYEEKGIYFGTFKDEKENLYFIWGPVSSESLSLKQQVEYRRSHQIKEKSYRIPEIERRVMSGLLAVACWCYCGKKLDMADIYMEWPEEEYSVSDEAMLEAYQLEKSEMDRSHNTIEYEELFEKIIENGDVEGMKKLQQASPLEDNEIGMVARDSVKRMEYLCVADVTLVSRAAIRGGMKPELAYDLSDLYLQKLEQSKTAEEMGMVTGKMQMDYTERVRKARMQKRGNLYVERCKDYIAAHLRKNFQVGEMADALKVNRSYLSKVFTEQEGITIQQYITRERCEHAANMLKYTDYSIALIGEYFCFSSQSHFGRQFKNVYGVTPNEYRTQNHHIQGFNKN